MTTIDPDKQLTDQGESRKLFEQTCRWDPYDEIAPALLNSRDIHRYAMRTGMVCPYDYKRLKSASYSICVGQRIIYWDEKGHQQDKHLKPDELFEFPKNSIVFVETNEKFRLPDYIAIRFNLKITLVHRGILLGTGPLVDPGYEGKLLIPLHNLTSNTYHLYAGQEFVWVEFTKISRHSLWRTPPGQKAEREKYDYQNNSLDYKPFPRSKKNMEPQQFLAKAHASPIRSSIPDILQQAKAKANQARNISGATLVAVIALVLAALMLAAQLVSHTDEKIQVLQDHVQQLEQRIAESVPVSRHDAGVRTQQRSQNER